MDMVRRLPYLLLYGTDLSFSAADEDQVGTDFVSNIHFRTEYSSLTAWGAGRLLG